jgi:anti-sigma factor RsiW
MTQNIEHLDSERISAFIDGELPDGEEQNARLHLNGCHRCALQVLSAQQLKAATARAGKRYALPPESLARLTAQLRPQPEAKAEQRIHWMRPVAWGSLAAGILLVSLLFGWRQMRQSNTLAAELLDQHLATLASGATPQVISTDRHTVKPWFQGRIPFSFNLPDTSALPPDTALKGGDLTYIQGQPAALLLFTIHKHEVSVFLTQRKEAPILAALPHSRSGFTFAPATTPELSLLAVSDVNPADLNLLVESLVKAQSPP